MVMKGDREPDGEKDHGITKVRRPCEPTKGRGTAWIEWQKKTNRPKKTDYEILLENDLHPSIKTSLLKCSIITLVLPTYTSSPPAPGKSSSLNSTFASTLNTLTSCPANNHAGTGTWNFNAYDASTLFSVPSSFNGSRNGPRCHEFSRQIPRWGTIRRGTRCGARI